MLKKKKRRGVTLGDKGLHVGCGAALFGQHDAQGLLYFIVLGQQPISDFSLEIRSGVLGSEFLRSGQRLNS